MMTDKEQRYLRTGLSLLLRKYGPKDKRIREVVEEAVKNGDIHQDEADAIMKYFGNNPKVAEI